MTVNTVSRFAVQFGKVRINTAISPNERILTSTSRISAFDSVLPFDVEHKGSILQAISAYFFTQTRDIIANHFIGCLDAQSMLVKSGHVLPLEVIVRATLSGSLWRTYSKHGPAHVEKTWGIRLPDGLRQHERFSTPIVTFTTKAAFGHDEVVTPAAATEHLAAWLSSQGFSEATQPTEGRTSTSPHDLLEQVQYAALRLFERGQEIALKAGLLLLDTKYEFALDANNRLMLVDEIHTPDASRYVDLQEFESGRIEHLSKEWLREIILQRVAEEDASPTPDNHHSVPFILRPLWKNKEFKEDLAAGLSTQYKKLFTRLFPQLTPWDVIAPHLIPWPVDPVVLRGAEAQQRLPSRVLVVGNGGRDFTIASFIEKAAEVDVVYCWPGRESWTGGKKMSLGRLSTEALLQICTQEHISWAVFGPEIPIAQGLAETLRSRGIHCLAPDLKGARLESSKIYTKTILNRAGCPTAESWTTSWSQLKFFASDTPPQSTTSNSAAALSPTLKTILNEYPYVLKYEALAAGKGVCLVNNADERAEAVAHFEKNLPEWLQELSTLAVDTETRQSGEPQFLIEKLLPGKEISAIALCCGEDFALLPYAQDFKRRNNGQAGPNTGGMGSVCPVFLPSQLDAQIRSIFAKTLKTLAQDGHPYRGFLFAGLMVDDNNSAQVLEFNCRLGDPETQVILPGLGRDVLLSMWLTSQNKPWALNPWIHSSAPHDVRHDGLQRCFVVIASPEYPQTSAPRRTLRLPQQWPADCEFIPSGVDANNHTTAGRIGGILATAQQSSAAVGKAYEWVDKIDFENDSPLETSTQSSATKPHFRTDIAFPCMSSEDSAHL
jgi:phosphoribosylamine--glycine ligase